MDGTFHWSLLRARWPSSALAGPGVVDERQHRRQQPLRRIRHQVGRAVPGEQFAHLAFVGREMCGYVHPDP
jgi:hypothetical protein